MIEYNEYNGKSSLYRTTFSEANVNKLLLLPNNNRLFYNMLNHRKGKGRFEK